VAGKCSQWSSTATAFNLESLADYLVNVNRSRYKTPLNFLGRALACRRIVSLPVSSRRQWGTLHRNDFMFAVYAHVDTGYRSVVSWFVYRLKLWRSISNKWFFVSKERHKYPLIRVAILCRPWSFSKTP
jgi:hypothetical protein